MLGLQNLFYQCIKIIHDNQTLHFCSDLCALLLTCNYIHRRKFVTGSAVISVCFQARKISIPVKTGSDQIDIRSQFIFDAIHDQGVFFHMWRHANRVFLVSPRYTLDLVQFPKNVRANPVKLFCRNYVAYFFEGVVLHDFSVCFFAMRAWSTWPFSESLSWFDGQAEYRLGTV